MSGREVLIRPMRAADVTRVLEISEHLANTPRWSRSAYLTALNPDAVPRRVALVAADPQQDVPVGFAIASVLAPSAELETVAVAREMQRRGVASEVLERLWAEIREAGATEMCLEVRVSNGAAIHLYRRAGFVEIGRRKAYYADPVEDATVMRITLT
jgi:ribosomal-protein-alanine N-acetyltransferase